MPSLRATRYNLQHHQLLRSVFSNQARGLVSVRTTLDTQQSENEVAEPDILQYINGGTKYTQPVPKRIYRYGLIQHSNDLPLCKRIIKLASANSPVDDSKVDQLQATTDILFWCLNDSIATRDITMAIDLYVKYYELHSNEPLNEPTASKLLLMISLNDPRHNQEYLEMFLKLCTLFKQRETPLPLTHFQLMSLCNVALSLESTSVVAKQVLNELMSIDFRLPGGKLRDDQIMVAYSSIDRDFDTNNAVGVFMTWSRIKNHYNSMERHDARIIYKVFKLCKANKRYRSVCRELLRRLSPRYYCNNPLLLPLIIDYITLIHSTPLAKELIRDMKLYTTPENQSVLWNSQRYLSSLLRMQLRFRDFENSDRILKRINEIFGKLSASNYRAICSHLLSTGKFEDIRKALKLVDSLEKEEALALYSLVLHKLVEWKLEGWDIFGTTAFTMINELLTKAHKLDQLHECQLWEVTASLYIKYLVDYKGKRNANNMQKRTGTPKGEDGSAGKHEDSKCLDLAKLIYIRSNRLPLTTNSDSNRTYAEIDYDPFNSSSPHTIKLKITPTNRIVILRNIALSAIHFKRKDIFYWCCSALHAQGLPIEELIVDWNMTLRHQIRKGEYASIKDLEKTIAEQGVKLVTNSLK